MSDVSSYEVGRASIFFACNGNNQKASSSIQTCLTPLGPPDNTCPPGPLLLLCVPCPPRQALYRRNAEAAAGEMPSRRKGHALLGYVGEDTASRWVSVICLLMCFAVLASGASRARPGTSTAAGASQLGLSGMLEDFYLPRGVFLNDFRILPSSSVFTGSS